MLPNTHKLSIDLIEQCVLDDALLKISESRIDNSRILDFGINSPGGIRAGLKLTEICMAGLAEVRFVQGHIGGFLDSSIQVLCDHPALACLGCQYAGWPVSTDEFFGMGSGAIRQIRGREELLNEFGEAHGPQHSVCVIESRQEVTEHVINWMRDDAKMDSSPFDVCIAPTASLAGTIQIVGRSIETTMHKLHHLGYDVFKVRSGFGLAPLPPVPDKDMLALGWTNDAILYGSDVQLWLNDEDDTLNELVDKIPSCSSQDFGQPFGELFKNYDYDFYQIDPLLFSPAKVTLHNLNTGRKFSAGEVRPDIINNAIQRR